VGVGRVVGVWCAGCKCEVIKGVLTFSTSLV